MKQLRECIYKSPIDEIGEIRVIADGERVCLLDFKGNDARVEELLKRRYDKFAITLQPDVLDMQNRLRRYFKGDWSAFDELKPEQIETAGTDFRESVWAELKKNPVGKTRSYSEVAIAIGRPKAAQAVGGANAKNPLAIIIPCHRVIGKNGSLRGWSGGIDRQKWLLRHEGVKGF